MEYKNYVACKNIDKEVEKIKKNNKLHKLILIEGTDCSGKQTQAEMLVENLKGLNILATKRQYPNYDSPTGYIIGAPYLGKPQMGECIFPEGSANVDPIVAGGLYAIDRYADKLNLVKELQNNIVILDRYMESNLAYQAGMLDDKKDRDKLFKYFNTLEYKLNKLQKPDIKIFIYMPYGYATLLKMNREEKPDGMELSKERLVRAENTYLEMVKKFGFKQINCIKDNVDATNPQITDIKSREEIQQEVLNYVVKKLKI